MQATWHDRRGVAVWDVARPARPGRVPGVDMAGFRDRGASPAGHRVVPHPGVTLVVEFGAGPLLVEHSAGREHRGSLAAGPGFGAGAARVRGERFEAVQVRLSPPAARAILGASPAESGGAVLALDDLWGREAERVRERLAGEPFLAVDGIAWSGR